MKHTDETYNEPLQLLTAHGCTKPSEYAREAYDRTECGVWTTFILRNGNSVPADDLRVDQDTHDWFTTMVIGIQHGTTMEGYDAEFESDPLMFPFDDKELADTWQYLEDQVNDYLGDGEDNDGCLEGNGEELLGD